MGNITIAPTPNMNAKGVNEGPVYPDCEVANRNIGPKDTAKNIPMMRPMTALIAPYIKAKGIAGILVIVFLSTIMHSWIQSLVYTA
jgi:hypothetical protein